MDQKDKVKLRRTVLLPPLMDNLNNISNNKAGHTILNIIIHMFNLLFLDKVKVNTNINDKRLSITPDLTINNSVGKDTGSRDTTTLMALMGIRPPSMVM
jgi:hypothetical protein